jgi:hypothetical protein
VFRCRYQKSKAFIALLVYGTLCRIMKQQSVLLFHDAVTGNLHLSQITKRARSLLLFWFTAPYATPGNSNLFRCFLVW